jgi:hypothetical protein
MRVGINGMGRIGRLALRASLGAVDRPTDDPRATGWASFTSTRSGAALRSPRTFLNSIAFTAAGVRGFRPWTTA